MPRRTRLVFAAAAVLLTTTLVGCTHAPAPTKADDGWSDRMDSLLSDDHGDGGAGGILTSDDHAAKSSAIIYLDGVTNGSFDAVGVCRGADTVRLTIVSAKSIKSSVKHGVVLGATDIACGATARLPIDIAQGGIEIRASGPTGSEFVARIVSRGWEPAPTTFG